MLIYQRVCQLDNTLIWLPMSHCQEGHRQETPCHPSPCRVQQASWRSWQRQPILISLMQKDNKKRYELWVCLKMGHSWAFPVWWLVFFYCWFCWLYINLYPIGIHRVQLPISSPWNSKCIVWSLVSWLRQSKTQLARRVVLALVPQRLHCCLEQGNNWDLHCVCVHFSMSFR